MSNWACAPCDWCHETSAMTMWEREKKSLWNYMFTKSLQETQHCFRNPRGILVREARWSGVERHVLTWAPSMFSWLACIYCINIIDLETVGKPLTWCRRPRSFQGSWRFQAPQNAGWGAVGTVTTCGICRAKPPWQPYRCHTGTQTPLHASERPAFPVPYQLPFKGHGRRQSGFFLNVSFNLGLLSVAVSQGGSERVACWQVFRAGDPAPFRMGPSSVLWRRAGSWVLRVYSFVAEGGSGEAVRERASGGFSGSRSISNWEQLPGKQNLKKKKKRKAHFCMRLQIFRWQDVLLCWKEVL